MRPKHLVITALMLIAVALVPAVEAAPTRGMTPRQVAELESVSAAEISPDGARVAVVRSVPRTLFDDEDGRPWTELVVVDPASGAERPFVAGKTTLSDLAWRPDGSAISFLAKRGDDEYDVLYLLPADGGEAVRAVALETDVAAYAFSPDGARVAVIAVEPELEEVKKLKKQGFTQKVLEENLRHRQLWIAELAGDAEPRRLELPGSVFQVRWSPAGDVFAVALAPTPLVDDRYMAQRIHLVSVEDGSVQATVEHAGKLGEMRFSPDGARLAFIAGADLNDPADGTLFVVPVAGGAPTALTGGLEATVEDFVWTGPTSVVALLAERSASTLVRFDVTTGESVRLEVTGTDAVLSSLTAGGDRLALVGSSPRHPSEAFAVALGGGAAQRLTDSNPWLADVALARQESITWTARDGLELEGVLVYPLERAEGTRVPLVLAVHGGPEGRDANGWTTRYSEPAQVLAARGFAVFLPNYRGSTGRGAAFAKLGQADAAGAEFDDLVDAVDHLVETGLADPDRVGVTGGSYGGYATAWLATRYSERFAAGVMFVGISNKISKFGTTDIPNEEFLVHALSYPWQKWQKMLERSPIYWVERARTPLLIVHGEDDPRVSVTQSEELFRALKVIGKTPVRMVTYPGEGHGNRRGASRYDLMVRLVRWMEHYLQGPGDAMPPAEIDYRSERDGWEAAPETGR